ncbi:MAG: amino acid ABC transporter substrate-binding protein [Rhodospirillales bacterium]|nr:amino acid ABC transporter substrate-binding protein [Rhodospirillales bacterium]
MRGFIAAILFAIYAITPAAAQETGGTLARIANSGTINLGYRHSSPPFSFLGNDQQPVGYSIDLCLRVAEAVKTRLGRPDLNVKFVAVEADDRLQKVVDGSIDIECGITTNTLSRQEQVDFTNTTFITGASLLVPAGSTVQSVADLAGKKVSVVGDTTTEKALRDRLATESVDARVITVSDHDKAMRMLAKGEVDAHAGDQIVLIGLARTAADPNKFVVAPELFTYEPYALVVRRNDADFRLVADRTLAQLYRSGEIMQVFEKWFAAWGGRPSRLLLAMYALNGLPE